MIRKYWSTILVLLVFGSIAGAQKARPKSPPTPVIFAVLNSGGTLEPIAYVKDKKLEPAVDGSAEAADLVAFHKNYLKPKTSYQLIFGGANAGLVTVKSASPDLECSRHTAATTILSTRTRLKGNVMAIAASPSLKPSGNGVRRLPTPAERTEIESLVRAELTKQKVPSAAVRKVKYQNLTAVDVDGDDVVEFVGSFWAEPTPKSRSLLFFIAEKGTDEKYHFSFSDFRTVEEKDTMSEDITTIDSGVYHELFLDMLDYDGDGSSEIFSYSPSFEGSGFNAYHHEDGKWVRVFEGSNYRCAY
jgi:hypothetical protein